MGRFKNPITKKIRDAHMTLTSWANKNNFDPTYVAHVVAGTAGKIYGPAGAGVAGDIVTKLKDDGYWVDFKRGKKDGK